MDPEPSAAGPDPPAPSKNGQASPGISTATQETGLLGKEEHAKPRLLPRKPNPFKSANGIGTSLDLEQDDLSITGAEPGAADGPRVDPDEGSEGNEVLHLSQRQDSLTVQAARNGPAIENARNATDKERVRLPDGLVLSTSLEEVPGVPTSPLGVRNTDTSIQVLAPRDKFVRVIGRVRTQLLLERIAKSLRNPNVGESLCKSCENLNLRIDDFFVDRRRTWQKRPEQRFGYLWDIDGKSKNCRLCRLVINAFKEQLDPREYLYGTQQVIQAKNLECLISWQIDGTEVVTDQYGDSTEVPQTRCICVKWPGSSYRDAYLILAYPNTVLGPERSFLGRLQSSLDKTVPEKLKEWYDICCNTHDRCKSGLMDTELQARFDTFRSEPYFGVVDLVEMRLTPLPPGAKYAALSYVWGDKKLREDKFKTKMEHVESLKVKNGLKQYFDQLPLTIQDATRVVRSIGLRYLWVDALSIIQDDDEFWSLNAPNMHLIYGNADVTVYAADGEGGNSGIKAFHALPGKYEFHYTQHIEYIKEDLNLMVWNPFERYLERSTWNTRAWTFQEYELSQRRLVFVEGRAYFQCPATTMSLDKYSEDTTPKKPHSALEEYRKSVSQYTPRKLAHEKDVEVAYSGIGTILCRRLGGEQLFCLPTSHFDWAILWQPESAPIRRTPESGERFDFPSWSWCGWKSTKIGYPSSFTAGCELDIGDWLVKHTWISWYVRDKLGNLNIVWRPSSHHAVSHDASARGYLAVNRQVRDQINTNEGAVEELDLYGRVLPQRLRDLKRNEFFKTMPRWPFNVRTNHPDYVPTAPYQRFLQFWTWSATFSVKPEDPHKPLGGKFEDPGQGLKRFWILDGDSEFAGSIVLDEHFVEHRGRVHEFIALSEARPFTHHEAEVWNHWETSQKESTEWYLYHVMLLEYEDGNHLVSRRAGLGKMYKRAFDRPVSTVRGASGGRIWKEIILG